MALESLTEDERARIATIAEAVVEQFGTDAIRVAERQAMSTSGDATESWEAIIRYLNARPDNTSPCRD